MVLVFTNRVHFYTENNSMEFLTEELKQHLTQNEKATYEILEEAYNTDELTEEGKKVLENLNRTAQKRAGIILALS